MLIKNTLLSVLALSFFTACHIETPQRKQVKQKDQLDTVWTEVVPLKRNLNILDTTVAHVGNSDSMMLKYNLSLDKLPAVVESIASQVKAYDKQPLYWVEIERQGTQKLLLELNDKPLTYAYTSGRPEYRIDYLNNYIDVSGVQNLRIRVFSRKISPFKRSTSPVAVRIGYAHDKRDGDGAPQYLTDTITLPKHVLDNGTQYWDTVITFHAEVPWDHSHRLNNATDLRTLPDLEARVMKKFEDLRLDFINCDITSLIHKDAERERYYMERLYKSNQNDIKNEIYKLKTSFIPNHPDKKVFPIEDYELALYKDGRIAHLRHFHYKNSVLKVQDFEPDLHPKPFTTNFSILLYLPEGASELQIY
jgi:hypothetical protein